MTELLHNVYESFHYLVSKSDIWDGSEKSLAVRKEAKQNFIGVPSRAVNNAIYTLCSSMYNYTRAQRQQSQLLVILLSGCFAAQGMYELRRLA
jgi:hypothetical protein